MRAQRSTLFVPPLIERVAAQVEVARQIAMGGSKPPAQRLCAALFVEHLPILIREPALLQAYVGCLLLLEMSALLPRLLRAAFGVDLVMTQRDGPLSRRWSLSFRGGIALLVPSFEPGTEAQSVLWARRILAAAAGIALDPPQSPPALARAADCG